MAVTKNQLTHISFKLDNIVQQIMDLTSDANFIAAQNAGTISKANILAAVTNLQGERGKAKQAHDTAFA